MASFSFNRFVNFGKYDFIINKAFYRNTSLLTIFIALGIALICFICRYLMYATTNYTLEAALSENGGFSPADSTFTEIILCTFTSIMLAILAGHAFHNLRNKQGRINELTLPATNLERWTWHVLTVTVGATLLIFASIVCADILNALLNLMVYGGEVHSSLTLGVFKVFTGYHISERLNIGDSFLLSLRVLMGLSFILTIAIYVFGNSVKYKYNIILTYITTFIIETVLLILGFATIGHWLENHPFSLDEKEAEQLVQIHGIAANAILLVLSILLFWGSYKLYSKAQITSRRNK